MKDKAVILENTGNYYLAAAYYHDSARWLQIKDKNDKNIIKLVVLQAKTYIHDADNRTSNGKRNMEGGSLYQNALEIIRTLPHNLRNKYFSSKEERKLVENIQDCGKKALSEMKVFSQTIDLSDCINKCKKITTGLSQPEALKVLATVPENINKKAATDFAIQELKQSPMLAMINTDCFSGDGRIVATAEGVNHSVEMNGEDAKVN